MANDTSDESTAIRQTSVCSPEVPTEGEHHNCRLPPHLPKVSFLTQPVVGLIHSFVDSAPSTCVPSYCVSATCSAAAILLLSSFWWIRRTQKSRRRTNHHAGPKSQGALSSSTHRRIDRARIDRKNDFLKRAGDNYGYRSSPAGHIDSWRSREFPHLTPPIAVAEDDAATLVSSSELEVYLDYAGAALPSRSQLESIMSHYFTAGALANPHSTGPAASRTMVLIEQAKKLVLDHFNGHPGKSHGIGAAARKDTKSGDLGPDHHPGYEVIFTSGTTESLRIVAESFRWTCGKEGDDDASRTDCGSRGSVLLYPHNSHTSVVGMRGPGMAKGGTFRCVPLEKLTSATSKDFSEWANESSAPREDGCRICSVDKSSEDSETINHLMVLSVECNFGGDRPDNIAKVIRKARQPFIERKANDQRPKSRWSILLDIAKAASTGPVDLRNLDPDFACLSFYKMFGEPTGLGVLFVKRSSLRLLEEKQTGDKSIGTNRYFGGGSVDVVLAGQNFVSSRSEPSAASSFVHGSIHFRGISTLVHGFEEVKRVGGMDKISAHSRCLAKEFVRRLNLLKHGNGRPLCIIYGAWSRFNHNDRLDRICVDPLTPGPTVAFNLLRSDGTIVGYNEVSNLAGLSKPPIQLRTGCFCNAGACQRALGLSDDQIQDNFLVAGHVCGDKKDTINGMATGAIRASFGKDSIWEDADAFLTFLANKFISNASARNKVAANTSTGTDKKKLQGPVEYEISEMFVFPIKSCAAMPVKRWQIDTGTGRLIYDREFALVDSSGAAMRLHSYPQMSQIAPTIDLERKLLIVSAPGCDDLTISLALDGCEKIEGSNSSGDDTTTGHIRVCGSKACANIWGGDEATEWFSSFLGVQCWLVRHKGEKSKSLNSNKRSIAANKAFANDASLLLVSQNSIDQLNSVLAEQHSNLVTSRHFRPNLVVKSHAPLERNHSGHELHPEDSWSRVEFIDHGIELVSDGPCARCQMVDVDPTSGMKGKTLRALSEYRRRGGQIVFGIFLSSSSTDVVSSQKHGGMVWICEGGALRCF